MTEPRTDDLRAALDDVERLEARIIERLNAIVSTRYNLGPIFQPDAIDRRQAIEVVQKQFSRALASPAPEDSQPVTRGQEADEALGIQADGSLGPMRDALHAEWYNGNLDEQAYERLDAIALRGQVREGIDVERWAPSFSGVMLPAQDGRWVSYDDLLRILAAARG